MPPLNKRRIGNAKNLINATAFNRVNTGGIAPKLTKAKVFSVVDAKDRFLQVVLDEPSSI